MHRRDTTAMLHFYEKTWAQGLISYPHFDANEERDTSARLLTFVARQPHCFERSCRGGHITASALVCSPGLDRVLLTLHAKLGKWLQLGGHTDGSSDVAAAAEREALEESGLASVHLVPAARLLPEMNLDSPPLYLPFDCDIHLIPARKDEPAHLHYDLRFLCLADPQETLQISHESKALRWLSLLEARELTQERSMIRQFDKLEALRPRLS